MNDLNYVNYSKYFNAIPLSLQTFHLKYQFSFEWNYPNYSNFPIIMLVFPDFEPVTGEKKIGLEKCFCSFMKGPFEKRQKNVDWLQPSLNSIES